MNKNLVFWETLTASSKNRGSKRMQFILTSGDANKPFLYFVFVGSASVSHPHGYVCGDGGGGVAFVRPYVRSGVDRDYGSRQISVV